MVLQGFALPLKVSRGVSTTLSPGVRFKPGSVQLNGERRLQHLNIHIRGQRQLPRGCNARTAGGKRLQNAVFIHGNDLRIRRRIAEPRAAAHGFKCGLKRIALAGAQFETIILKAES